jgi:hypothetical protein
MMEKREEGVAAPVTTRGEGRTTSTNKSREVVPYTDTRRLPTSKREKIQGGHTSKTTRENTPRRPHPKTKLNKSSRIKNLNKRSKGGRMNVCKSERGEVLL